MSSRRRGLRWEPLRRVRFSSGRRGESSTDGRSVGGVLVGGARIALGAVASRPFLVEKAGEFLKGRKLGDEVIAQAAELVANRAKPMDNTDMDLYWRQA